MNSNILSLDDDLISNNINEQIFMLNNNKSNFNWLWACIIIILIIGLMYNTYKKKYNMPLARINLHN